MPRPKKSVQHRIQLTDDQIRQAVNGDMPCEELRRLLENRAIKKGIIKPSLTEDPQIKSSVDLLTGWCKRFGKKLIITPSEVIIKLKPRKS